MPREGRRISVATLILLVATAASAFGLVAALARLDDDEDDPRVAGFLGAMLVVSIVGAEGLVGLRLRGSAGRRLLRVCLACLGFTALIRLLEWGGGAAFMMALAAALAAGGFAAAINADWTRATGRGLLDDWPGAGELAASTFLVMVLGLLGMIPLSILAGMVIRLILLF